MSARWFRWGWGEGKNSRRGSLDLGQVAHVLIERESGYGDFAHITLRSGLRETLNDETALRFAEVWEHWLEAQP